MAALTVPTIFTAVDKMSSVLSKMQGNVGKFASENQKKYAAMSRSMQSIQTNASQIGMAAGILGTALVAPLVLATKAASDFEDQMATIGTTVGAKNVPLLSAGVLETLKHTTAPLQELTDGLYKITSAGVPAAEAIKVLDQAAELALIGRGTVPEAADALTSAMNVFKDEGLSSNKIMSMLFQTVATGKTTIAGMSESFGATANVIHHGGVSMKDMLAGVKAMTVMGEPASQAMNQIRASVFGLEMPSKRMKIIFNDLGVKNIHQLIKKFGDLGGAMKAVQDMGNKHGMSMASAWHKIGSYAAVVNLTSETGMASYKQGQLDMANSEKAAAAAYALKMKTLAAQLKLVQNNMQAFLISLGTTLIPVLTALLPKISALVDMVGKWIDRHQVLARWILVITGGLGGLLLVIAPLAFAVAGVASVMKLWAGYQLLLAEKAALATAALTTEAVAVADVGVAATGAGTQLSLFATEAGAADIAAVGFFATLSEFVLPASLVALSGLAIWKFLDQAKWDNNIHKMDYYNPKTAVGQISPFSNKQEESDYQKYYLQQRKAGVPDSLAQRDAFDKQFGKKEAYKPLIDPLLFNHIVDSLGTRNPNNRIDLHINDPGGHLDSAKTSAPAHIPISLHQGSTTGKQ